MNWAVVRPPEIAPRHIEIASVDETAIALDQGRPVEPIEFRDLIPGQPVSPMMTRREVIDQEAGAPDPGVFGDRRPPFPLRHCATLGEGTHHREACAGVDEAGE